MTKTQKNLISVDLDLWHFSVLLVIPTAVELSLCMAMGGCGRPISSRVSQNIVTCLHLRKRAPSSASAVDAMMNLKIAHSVKNVSFNLMGPVRSGFHPLKNVPAHSAVGICF